MNRPKRASATGALLLAGTALVLTVAGPASWARTPTRPAYADGPPAAHTGGFGEPTCQACHAGLDLNAPGGALGVEGVPRAYEPGGSYLVTVVLHSEDMGRAGFQGAFRFDTGSLRGKQAGRLRPEDTRVAVRQDDHSGIQYVQHTAAGADVSASDIVTWSFTWTAPQRGIRVVFDVAANAGNGDDSPFGDFIYTTEAATTGQ